METQQDRHDRPTYHQLVAEHIAANPSAVALARANIARWLASGQVAVAPHLAWDALLVEAQRSEAGFAALLAVLRGDAPQSAALLEYSPFAGVLSREVRRLARDRCGFRH